MRLLVVDGNSIVNRAFYGIKLLTTKDGQFTNGIYGFLNILIKLKEECEPDRVAIAFDLKAPTFRHKMYDGYKAGRKGMPAELASQMPLLKEILGYLGYAIVEKEGYEADDILGTLSACCKGDDRCFIATGDRDSLQLVSENTNVLLAATKMGKAVTVVYDTEKIKEDYGVQPKQMIEIKALMGDSSDNIPGVAGIGQKTAGDLIQRFGNIDYIYENLDTLEIKKGVHDKLANDKDNAYLSRTLGTICLDAPINTDMDSYIPKPVDTASAIRLLVKLEMFGIIEKLGLTREGFTVADESKSESEKSKFTLTEERDLCALLGVFKKSGEVYFTADISGNNLNGFFFYADNEVKYVPADCLDFDSFTESFFSGEWKKYTCDVKPLYKYALIKGYELINVCMDTTLAGYILNPSASGYDPIRLAGELNITVPELECADSIHENALAAAVMKPVCERIKEQIEQNEEEQLLYEIELPLAKVLADMEHNGFLVDKDAIASYGEQLQLRIDEITASIFAEVGFEFNLNSPKQLGEALFEKMGLPAKKKTKSGYSTSAEVLESLACDYPIVADILKYRTLAKLKSTYCDGLLKVIDSDGRIRSTLNQTETRTGRISSLEPNLQNIPVRREEGREIRRFFTADDGKVLVDADYSQIELRVLAHIADDKTMIDAFNNGEDIHTITASQVFNMPQMMVTPLMRSRAKAVNFGIVYGIGAFSLAKDIGVTRKEADNYIKGYLHHYSGIDKYMQQVVAQSREDGFAKTIFNRRRYLPELTASNKMLQAFGERVARNMPVQGTAADIIKIAMVRVYERLKKEKLSAKLIMQVHDELIVECDESEKDVVSFLLKEEMENACKMKVKLLADVHAGKTWYEAKE
ncbi:MAG: DNA polymerase I [Faecalibacterium sp.]|nr:DNA polymerase I [Ruminococcus sp.]MCM1393186.1 DNA polymerase I [Ruminococcus sp.]MCM1485425.1 DNA polymerase I [Faecalibacterium sp.]